jgi:hypothetical protein
VLIKDFFDDQFTPELRRKPRMKTVKVIWAAGGRSRPTEQATSLTRQISNNALKQWPEIKQAQNPANRQSVSRFLCRIFGMCRDIG